MKPVRLLIVFQVAGKKARDAAAADAEMMEKRKATDSDKENEQETGEHADILGEREDADVIF